MIAKISKLYRKETERQSFLHSKSEYSLSLKLSIPYINAFAQTLQNFKKVRKTKGKRL